MATANTADFLGEGTADAAFAPSKTPEQIAEEQKLLAIRQQIENRRAAEATADNTNLGTAGERRAYNREQAIESAKTRAGPAGQAGNDWLYPGIVAGTMLGAVGGGALVGGLAPAAAGSTAAGSAALAAPYAAGGAYGATVPGGLAAAYGAPAAAGATMGTPFSMASPFAAPAAGAAVPAAGAAAPAAAKAAESWLTPGNVIGGLGLAADVGGIIASQIRTKAEKALIEKQKELAAATKARQLQVQREGMNRLGQQIQAMVPLNKAMADMYGPDAAFTGQQMGAAAADPGANETDPVRMADDQRRQQQVAAAFGPPSRGPAPLQPRAPQAARRF